MMRSLLVATFVLLAISSIGATEEDHLAFIYYYGWYGNPTNDQQWFHWQDYDHKPPADISSAFYPRLGAYSSQDPSVQEQHVRWIAGANINVIIYSWWGRDDPTDTGAKAILDLAADYGLKVAFMIEPYEGRNARTLCDDMEYLSERFSRHPAFFKMTRRTQFSTESGRRGVFFIYDPQYPEGSLQNLADTVHASNHDSLILLQSTDVGFAERVHADGIFAYEAFQNLQHFYKGLVETARNENLLFIPCVSPGFNVNRTFGKKSPIYRSRKLGKTYDDWWERVVAAGAEDVAVISFNEWHEGTQIEPAASHPGYLDYNGAYGKAHSPSEQSYLRRTARWIDLYQRSSP